MAAKIWPMQATTASVSGHVSDQNSAAVPDALIQITNLDTPIATTAKTGATGLYVFPSLALSLTPGAIPMSTAQSSGSESIAQTWTSQVTIASRLHSFRRSGPRFASCSTVARS